MESFISFNKFSVRIENNKILWKLLSIKMYVENVKNNVIDVIIVDNINGVDGPLQ